VSDILPFSAACERNKDVILETLSPYLADVNIVLEIGSGTAQHAVHFARAQSHLVWQTSDQTQYIDGIVSQLKYAELDNILAPIVIDVKQVQWVPDGKKYSAIYSANTLHIMNASEVEVFFQGLPLVSKDKAYLFIYGPFKYEGAFTSESNAEFDRSLRSRECGSAIRDFEVIETYANKAGFNLIKDHKMPANNQLLVFQKQSS